MSEQNTQIAQHAAAVSALFAERHGQMVGYAHRRLRHYGIPPSAADPEDVVQTSFAIVLAHTEPIEKLRPYVFTVIRNEVGHAARHYYTGRGYASLDADVQLEAATSTVDPCPEVDLRLDVAGALTTLPKQQRRAVLLTQEMGLTQAQTAKVMGAAPGTVGPLCRGGDVAEDWRAAGRPGRGR